MLGVKGTLRHDEVNQVKFTSSHVTCVESSPLTHRLEQLDRDHFESICSTRKVRGSFVYFCFSFKFKRLRVFSTSCFHLLVNKSPCVCTQRVVAEGQTPATIYSA